jgi:1,4-dihydroxy-2-naphthoate octaprenyltransferase
MNKYIKALRAPFISGSIAPVLIGASLAFVDIEGAFPWLNFIMALIGVASLHTAANLINDFYDAGGSDAINFHVTPFSGGSRAIQEKGLNLNAVLGMIIFFLFIALAAALWMATKAGRPLVIPIGLLGLFIGWAYSTPPLQLMSKGWGEIIIFFGFGPLVSLGAYYAIIGHMNVDSFVIGIPQGFLITGVIWVNEFPDYEADKSVGKNNLVVRLGPEMARYLYCMIMAMSFMSIIFIVAIWQISFFIMLGFISLPLAITAMKIAWKEYMSYENIVPAQALTVKTVLAQGLLISLGLVISRLVSGYIKI